MTVTDTDTLALSYYPGCAAHSTAIDQERSTRALCDALDITLSDIEDWSCCGATAAHSIGGHLVEQLGERNIAIAEKSEKDVLVPCAACYGNLRRAAAARPAPPSLDIISMPTLLTRPEIMNRLRQRMAQSLNELPVAAYYGCLLVRPKTAGDGNPENPMEMDDLVALLGGRPVPWSYKTECCGGAHTLSHPETVTRLTERIVDMARRAGAELVVTACPMCHASLEATQWEARKQNKSLPVLPVLFLSELAALALKVPKPNRWLKRHLIDPRPLLREKGILK